MKRGRFPLAAVGILSAALLASGCGDIRDAAGSFRAMDQQQSEQCDGVPPPAALTLLEKTATVVSAVVCEKGEEYVAGQGSWEISTVRKVPPDRIPELAAGLHLTDVPEGAATCTLSMGVLPDFVVTLADGSRARPAIAGDGCHARRDALAALGDVGKMPIAGKTRMTQVRTDVDVVAGCGAGGKSPAVWLSSNADITAALTLPKAGRVSVCRYRSTADQEGELATAGTLPAEDLSRSWPTVSSTEPADCAQPADAAQTPATDWVLLLQTPKPPYRLDQPASNPIALVELGGCRRVVDPRGGLVGFIAASAASALGALADQPAE